MAYKKISLFILLLIIIISCKEKEVRVVETVIQNPADQSSTPSSSDLNNNDLNQIIENINSGDLQYNDAMDDLQIAIGEYIDDQDDQIIDDDHPVDESIDDYYENARKLAVTINSLKGPNEISNIADILNVEKFQYMEDEDLKTNVNKLFIELSSMKRKVSLMEDLFLINFVNLQKEKYGVNNNDNFIGNEVIDYFTKRINKTSREYSGYSETVLAYYACLIDIIGDDTRNKVMNLYSNTIQNTVISDPPSNNIKKLYKHMLKNWVAEKLDATLPTKEMFNFSHFKSILILMSDSVDNLTTVSGVNNAIKLLNNINKFFDKSADELSHTISRKQWNSFLDQRFIIMNKFKERLEKLMPLNIKGLVRLSNDEENHAYVRLYALKALMNIGEANSYVNNKHSLTEYFEERNYQNSTTVNDKEVLRNSYYAVEYYKFKLEEGSTKKEFYNNLKINLVVALNKYYDKEIDINDIFNTSGQSLHELTDNSPQLINDTLVLDFMLGSAGSEQNDVEIPAGIYVSNKNINIVGEKIIFHPLAMIYTPGKNINIKASVVRNIWLDTSAERPKISQAKSFNSYFDLLIPTQIQSGKSWSIDWHGVKEQIMTPLMQTSGNSGSNAGDITIDVKENIFGTTLLMAIGADAENGHDGISSRQCDEQTKACVPWQLFIGTLTTSTSQGRCKRTRTYECVM